MPFFKVTETMVVRLTKESTVEADSAEDAANQRKWKRSVPTDVGASAPTPWEIAEVVELPDAGMLNASDDELEDLVEDLDMMADELTQLFDLF